MKKHLTHSHQFTYTYVRSILLQGDGERLIAVADDRERSASIALHPGARRRVLERHPQLGRGDRC